MAETNTAFGAQAELLQAQLAADSGQLDGARAHAAQYEELSQRGLPDQHPQRLRIQLELLELRRMLGDQVAHDASALCTQLVRRSEAYPASSRLHSRCRALL